MVHDSSVAPEFDGVGRVVGTVATPRKALRGTITSRNEEDGRSRAAGVTTEWGRSRGASWKRRGVGGGGRGGGGGARRRRRSSDILGGQPTLSKRDLRERGGVMERRRSCRIANGQRRGGLSGGLRRRGKRSWEIGGLNSISFSQEKIGGGLRGWRKRNGGVRKRGGGNRGQGHSSNVLEGQLLLSKRDLRERGSVMERNGSRRGVDG